MEVFMLFYNVGIIRLTKKKVEKWNQTENTEKLIFALENGLYDIRCLAAKFLGKRKEERVINALRVSLNDNVKVVSIESAKSLVKLTENVEILKDIEEKLEYWKQHEARKREGSHKHNYTNIPKWKKRDWVAILKAQLKKPIRW
jgi:tagatose-1,6-bisphosphate aldolase